MSTKVNSLTHALEDYLETIYLIIRDHKLARVRDIAKARGVKMGSVTPAMKRLSELGLIEYTQREYIDLTEEGHRIARRTLARHDILRRFFLEVLQISDEAAEADACAMEHHFSNEGMDKLTRFFEFMERCPEGHDSFLERFHRCSAIQPELEHRTSNCSGTSSKQCKINKSLKYPQRSIADLRPTESGTITQVNAKGAIRQRLLDMGLLPNTEITLERLAPSGDPVWIKLQGFQLSLRRQEAQSVLIRN